MKKIKFLKHRAGELFKSYEQDLAKGFRIGIGFLLAIGTAGLLAVSVTGTFNTFSSGGVMKAADINANFASLKAVIEGMPNWTSSGANAVFSGGNVTVGGKVTGSNLGLYCGNTNSIPNGGSFTSGLTTGNIIYSGQGGYPGAKKACETGCSNTNAHMCSAHEIAISFQMNLVPATVMYYSGSSNVVGSGSEECGGWTVGTGAGNGTCVSTSPLRATYGDCSIARLVACCL